MHSRVVMGFLTAGITVALVGGALLFKKVSDTADANSHFICAFGHAISERPLKPRSEESAKDFRIRVKQTRQFVRDLEAELNDCEQPTLIVIDPEAKDELREARAQRDRNDRDARHERQREARGGDADPSPNQGSGQGGGHDAPDLPNLDPPNPGHGGGISTVPPAPPPPDAISEVCELWDQLMPELPADDPVAPLLCP